jgi:hypothetical protein
MTYISKADAITKLTSGLIQNDSYSIYTSDNNLDLNTIFYTNSAKTTLLPQGNYVLPTNYRSLWIPIGSNGKLTTYPSYLITTDSDLSWVNDTIYSRQTQTRYKHGRTDTVLVNNLLTDNAWYNQSFGQSTKQWVCGMGPRSTTPVTNLDLSDMAGFDLLFYSGPYSTYNEFMNNFGSTYFVHMKQDINKSTISTQNTVRKIYFFKPDYWYSKPTINKSTFFNRNPNIPSIKNDRGVVKSLDILANYVHDVLEIDKTTVKTSTRKQRGINTESYNPDPKFTTTEYLGGNAVGYANIPYSGDKVTGITFDQPNILSFHFPLVWGYEFRPANSDLDQVRITATFRSMYLEDFTGSYTYNGITVSYAQANPFQWTCDRNSGTGGASVHPTQYMLETLGSLTTARNWHWDFEWFWVLGKDYEGMKGVFKCLEKARDIMAIDSPSTPIIKISWYAGGVYRSDFIWDTFNSSNVTTTLYYTDYHNYYINNADKYTMSGYFRRDFYEHAGNFSHFAVSNYLNGYNTKWYFHQMVHQYDISNKLCKEKLGNNHPIKIQSYMFQVYETLTDSSMQAMLKGSTIAGAEASAKPDLSPDFYQSLAAWSYGYADGMFLWEAPGSEWNFENYQDYNALIYDEEKKEFREENFEKFANNFSSQDWFYATIYTMYQNKDIIEAATDWQYASQSKGNSTYTTGTENYPVVTYANSRPLIAIKYNVAGTEALILAINPFNNGYTKSSIDIKVFNDRIITIDMWGNYTTILRTVKL